MLKMPLPARLMPRLVCKVVKPVVNCKVPPFKLMLSASKLAGSAPKLRSVLMAKVPALICVPPA